MKMKKLSIFMVSFLFVILILGIASSLKFDNVVSYKNENKTFVIDNAFGLGGEVGEVTLTSHKNVNEPITVQVGSNIPVMRYTVVGELSLDGVDFINMNTGKPVSKSFRFNKLTYRIKQVPVIITHCPNPKDKEDCTQEIIRYDTVTEEVRTPYTKSKTENGMTIELVTDVQLGDYVDGIWTLEGRKIDRQASWNATFDIGLRGVYEFNETGGDIIERVRGNYNLSTNSIPFYNVTTPTLTNGIRMTTSGQYAKYASSQDVFGGVNGTVVMWVQTDQNYASASIRDIMGDASGGAWRIGTVASALKVNIGNVNVISSGTTYWNGGQNIMLTLTWDSSSNTTKLYVNDTLVITSTTGVTNYSYPLGFGFGDTNGRDYEGNITDAKFYNRSLSQGEISLHYNGGLGLGYLSTASSAGTFVNVTLIYPQDDFSASSSVIIFQTNSSISNGNLTNITMRIWNATNGIFSTNFTTITGTTNVTNFTVGGIPLAGGFKWNSVSCGTNASGYTFCNQQSSNNTFQRLTFDENAISYSQSVYDTSRQFFQLNITAIPEIISLVADLVYNGTSYPSTVSCTLPNCTLSNSLDIPLIENQFFSVNKSFFWNVTYHTSADVSTTTSTRRFQNVTRAILNICNSSNLGVPYVNFTVFDQSNPTTSVSSTIQATWNYWLGTGIVQRNSSYNNQSMTGNQFKFCANPNNTIYSTTADFVFDSTGFSQNTYHFNNRTISTNVTDLKIYLLNDTATSLTVFKFVDEAQRGIQGYLFGVYLYDIGTGQKILTAVGKTDQNGEDIIPINWVTSSYEIRVYDKSNNLVLTIPPYKISSTPQVFTIAADNVFSQDKFRSLIYDLTFNPNTNEYVLTFNDPNNEITAGCLRVVKGSILNYQTLYDQCVDATSGTLSYAIGTNATGNYLAVFYAKGSFAIIASLEQLIKASGSAYSLIGNINGSVLALLLVGTFAMIGLLISPSAAVIMIIVGMVASLALGFQQLNSTTYFLAFIAGALYLVYKLNT